MNKKLEPISTSIRMDKDTKRLLKTFSAEQGISAGLFLNIILTRMRKLTLSERDIIFLRPETFVKKMTK